MAELTLATASAKANLRSRALDPEGLLLILIAAYVGAVALLPLLRLFVEGLSPGARVEPLGVLLNQWRSPVTARVLWNTVEVSLSSVIVSVALGGAMAVVLGTTNVRAKAALTFSLLLPLLVPPHGPAVHYAPLAWVGAGGQVTDLRLAFPPVYALVNGVGRLAARGERGSDGRAALPMHLTVTARKPVHG